MTEDADSTAGATPGEYTVTLRCQKCGSDELTIPDDATDDSHVTCAACGVDCGRWGDVQSAAFESTTEKIKESIADTFGQAFDGLDGITFKKTE
jgi:hypothetical protein